MSDEHPGPNGSATEAELRAAVASLGDPELRAASSILLDRWRFFNQAGITFGGLRDLYQILGYKRILTFRDFWDRYTRDGIAKRVVEAFPKATWRGGVELYEDDDPNTNTAFEQAVQTHLVDRLALWSTLQSVDILAGLSTYAVLLIGAPGDMSTELPRGGPDKLAFLKAYSGGGGPGGSSRSRAAAYDASASIEQFDVDPASPRFGQPLSYRIRFSDLATPLVDKSIHWSRIVHVAEGCLEDDVYGQPSLENVWNLFDDLAKVTGGGSEAYWLRANQGLHLNVDKDVGLSSNPSKPTTGGVGPDERAALREKAEELQHQLQRVLVTRGVDAKQLGSDVANFGQSADAIMKQIAGSKGIPMRILTGSEMGELASSQDAANFDSQVQDRRTGYAGPKIVRRLIDRLIKYGYLPTPKQYEVGWPVEANMDERGKAGYAAALAGVNQAYGSVVFTDDEIRDMAFDMRPLTPEEKGQMEEPPPMEPPPAEPLDALMAAELRQLEAAIEANDVEAVVRFVGLGDVPGHEFHGNQYTEKGAGDSGRAHGEVVAKSKYGQIEIVKSSDGSVRYLGRRKNGENVGTFKYINSAKDALRSPKNKEMFPSGYRSPDVAWKHLEAHSYATLQIQLPSSFAKFAEQIQESDLAPKGRVSDPHVTLRWGLLSDDPEPARQLLAGRGPIGLTLGKLGVFETPDGDALYVSVVSPDLERLNALVTERLPAAETHDYVPHATVAYLKPGRGARWAAMPSPFEGERHVVSEATFVSSQDERTTLSVSGC